MSERPRVSLYIPCYNGERYIAQCIEGVLAQYRKPDELFVVDDGSTDRTAEIAARYQEVTVLRHKRNSGLAAARNTAIAASTGDFIASLDADCVADKLWLYTLLQIMTRLPDNVGGIGGKLIEEFQETPADEFRAVFMCQHQGDEPLINPKFIAGANTLFRRQALINVGGYHEAFRTNGEDVQVCLKLQQVGFHLAYEPRAVVMHQRRDTAASVVRMNWAHWRHPMSIISPVTTLSRALPRAWRRVKYAIQVLCAIGNMRKYRLFPIAFRCLLITPFWELREWWRIKRANAAAQYEALAIEAQTISLQPLQSSAELLTPNN